MPETENSEGLSPGRPRRAGRPKTRSTDWKNTRTALDKLENLLKCKICSNKLKEPYFVGSCEHIFCKECVQSFSGKHCPECNLPVQAKEAQRDHTISNVLNSAMKLKSLINQEHSDDSGSDVKEDSKVTRPRRLKNADDKINGNKMEVADTKTGSPTSSTRSKRRSGLRTGCVSSPNVANEPNKPTTPGLRLKRNIKGETPLHLAAIKGDVVTIRRLLHQGANPNEKDNAGWTPLHEACHHGHDAIVEILLNNGAFIDIPACDNETPLHDAVSMGKNSIVCLLVSRGANINARNSAGITPVDMAKTDEIKMALNTPVELHSSGQSTKSINLVPKIDDIVLLKTGLNQEQEQELFDCAEILNAEVVDKFNEKVTHLITVCNDVGHCQRTMKFLQAILTGKWILNYSWVEECIAFKRRVFEEPYEVVGNKNQMSTYGPKKSRLNSVQQFPPLFDGCSFFLLGSFEFPSPNRDNLIMLIKLGGGIVLNREPRSATVTNTTANTVPFHAAQDAKGAVCPANQFIVYQDVLPQRFNNNCDKFIRCVKFNWLLDCITSYQLLPPEPS